MMKPPEEMNDSSCGKGREGMMDVVAPQNFVASISRCRSWGGRRLSRASKSIVWVKLRYPTRAEGTSR